MMINWDALSTGVAAIGVLIAAIGVVTSLRIAVNVSRQSQRQQILPIWKEVISLIRRIHPDGNVSSDEDIRNTLNGMLLVETARRMDVVEEEVLREMFGSLFVNAFNDIQAVGRNVVIDRTEKPGRDFITPELRTLYSSWSQTR